MNNQIPQLIQDMMIVEHLWKRNESVSSDLNRIPYSSLQLDASSSDFLGNLITIADDRLINMVKWCKSLPPLQEILVDDQIALLINSWCELLILTSCYQSMTTSGLIRISSTKSISLIESEKLGIEAVISKMIVS